MGTLLAAGIFAAAVSLIIWGLVAIDRAFFGEDDDEEGLPDGSGEPSPGKYTKDEIPFN